MLAAPCVGGDHDKRRVRLAVAWPVDESLRSFTVRARLPEALVPLQELAFNLRWSWDNRTRDLFRWVDPQIWELTFHDPSGCSSLVGRQRLDQLAADPAFMGFLGEMHDDLRRYLEAPRWFQNRAGEPAAQCGLLSPPSSASPRPCPSTQAAWGCWPATT